MKPYDSFFLVVSVLFLTFYGFSSNADAQPFGILQQNSGTESRKSILSTPGGRFIFGQLSESSKDQFMLDTHTGRLWKISERGDIGIFLTAVPYRTADGKYAPTPEVVQDPDATKSSRD